MPSVADELAPLLRTIIGPELPVRIECWDGSRLGPDDSRTTLQLRSPNVLRRLLWAPNELGLARAYVSGDADVEGDVFGLFALRDAMAARDEDLRLDLGWRTRLAIMRAARRLGALGPPLSAPPEEARLSGRRHSRERDAQAVSHHYDVSNDFYRLVLGGTMTYSCAYFESPDAKLDDAQRAKHELICRKLALRAGMRLLDVGCGWGGMVMHAAREHRVNAVGITISSAQAELAEKRVGEAGLADRIEIRLQDYRDVKDGPYHAISSIGMFEHVGLSQLETYFAALHRLLAAGGRLLNHAIARPDPQRSAFEPDSFIARYVFPDGELHEVGTVITAMQKLGYEVRDVEALREHYARTLRRWVGNLEANWDRAVRLAGEARARIWRLYMAASAINFEAGRIGVNQVLAVKPDREGSSRMAATRAAWYA